MFDPVRPISAVAQNILEKRYLHPGETTWEHIVDRVLSTVTPEKDDYKDTRDMLLHRYFIPNSPTLFNAGLKDAGLSACYVVGVEDTTEDIMRAFSDFVYVARKGGGCGISLSKLRPEGDPVAGSSHGYAAGPVALYDALCHLMLAFTQSGRRQMAMMATMHVRHPDIMKFITAKETEGVMTTTNISVVVDDAFMNAVLLDKTYWTEFQGKKYEELRARDVFQAIVDGAWANGEPGLIFENKVNNSPYQYSGEWITATNPCGEQGLPENGVCNLGSIDISKYMKDGYFDRALLYRTVVLATRFLDKVISVNTYPTKGITGWAHDHRPIGIGIMGYADLLLNLGITYGSEESLKMLDDIMEFIYKIAEEESIRLGEEKGVPLACKNLPIPRRNITLLSIAPTGTISLLADCSSGIEPIFSEVTLRTDTTGSYSMPHPYADKPFFRCAVSANGAQEVTWQEHINVQNISQKWVDSGVSKTINCPQMTRRETIWKMFIDAWQKDYIKGITVYRNQSRTKEVLTPKAVRKDKCPVCGEPLVKESGCKHCSKCDFSVCEIG